MARVLVVDDSAFQRNRMRAALAGEGHEVAFATNGREALEAIRTSQPDCVFLDLVMPEMTGTEVLEDLQRQGNTIPVIVVTADVQMATQKRCQELGAMKLVTKPLQAEDVQGLLKSVLAGSGGARI